MRDAAVIRLDDERLDIAQVLIVTRLHGRATFEPKLTRWNPGFGDGYWSLRRSQIRHIDGLVTVLAVPHLHLLGGDDRLSLGRGGGDEVGDGELREARQFRAREFQPDLVFRGVRYSI